MSNLKKIVIFLAIIALVLPISAFSYVYYKLNSIHDPNADEVLLNNNNYKYSNKINNILLVGTDGRVSNDSGTRSDAMMILTIDDKHKSLKLTSLARDSFVDIPGKGKEKLTHAYAYGGINLLVETIENNFEIDIQDYAVVDFFSFMDIVDSLNGLNLDVKQSEIEELSKYTEECYYLNDDTNKGSLEIINYPGIQNLNGYQALAYARIRHNDTALDRDRRQREIVEAITKSLKNLPATKYPGLANAILPYVKTNMKPSDITALAAKTLGLSSGGVHQLEFPIDDDINSTGGIVDGKGWVLQYTPESLEILHNFILNNEYTN